MAKNSSSGASSDAAWLRLYAAVAVLPLALTACGGGGGGGSPTPPLTPPSAPTPAPTASIVVTPSATSTSPNGAAITLNAVVTGSTATPTWTLTGAGTLSTTSGNVITYTPPDSEDFDENATVSISASVSGAITQSVSLSLTSRVIAGLNWANVSTTSIGTLQSIDYADGRYVAVSDSGSGLTSTDAATWTAATVLSSSTATDHFNARSVVHIGTTFVAAGSLSPAPYTATAAAIATSTDGMNWAMVSAPVVNSQVHGLIAGDHFVALGDAGRIFASADGHTWVSQGQLVNTPNLNAGAYSGSRYIAVGDSGYVAISLNGSVWQASPVLPAVGGVTPNLHGAAWAGTQFVAVGDNGTIATSPDGFQWNTVTSALTGTLRSVAVSSAGEIVVVGDAGIETSKDGVKWHTRDEAGAAALYGVNWVNSQFVAVGATSAIKTSTH